MIDLLRRYFVGNTAQILSIRHHPTLPPRTPFVRCRCGNADGFFWRRWQVTWRIPYAKVWHWNPTAKRWEIGGRGA